VAGTDAPYEIIDRDFFCLPNQARLREKKAQ